MNVKKFKIDGPLLFDLRTFRDDRGFFVERYRRDSFSKIDFNIDFCQDNFSRSAPRVLRGLHYQWSGPQGKLVTTLSGRIFDVAVDIRRDSPTFGQHISVELDGDRPEWFWIPAGFAHGFCVLGDKPADVLYKVDHPYAPSSEGGILWSDPTLAISWPVATPLLSPKDDVLPSFLNYAENPKF